MFEALIFSAGLGTRLMPLTADRPKAMVEISGQPLLHHALMKLQGLPLSKIYINAHHHAGIISQFVADRRNKYAAPLHLLDEAEKLLDTGGAIKAMPQSAKHLLCFNVDVLFSLRLGDFINEYTDKNPAAMLLVKNRHTSRKLAFDAGRLCGWVNLETGAAKGTNPVSAQQYAFSGVQVLSPAMRKEFTAYPADVFSVIDCYMRCCSTMEISPCTAEHKWMDVGRYSQWNEARLFFDSLHDC
jgi:N-acetyl-alpha-D-muramate 1-phosphate uridylyltransferase